MQTATVAEASDPKRLLRARDVWGRIGVSRSTFYALVRDEEFPAGKRISKGVVVWREADVDAWIIARLDAA